MPDQSRIVSFSRAAAASVGMAALALHAGAVQAQTVSPVTVTPQTLVPEHREGGVRVEIPEAGALQPPAGAENLTVTLGDIRVEGGFAEVAEQTRAVTSRLTGHQVTLRDIYAAASAIEAIHARAGFVLARVSVPPQDLASGATLRIVVTDGFVEAVDVSGLPGRVRGAVRARTAGLVGRRHVTLHQIEQALLIAGDVPGLSLRSTLARGNTPGGTAIVLEGSQALVSGSLAYDNGLDPSLGRGEVSLQLALNSALGLGEQIYGFVASGYQLNRLAGATPRERVVGGGVILPLGDGRFSINPEAILARTTPNPGPAPAMGVAPPPTVGDLRRLTLRLNQTLWRSRGEQTGLSLAIEQIDEINAYTSVSNQQISHDRYVALRPGLAWNAVSPHGTVYGINIQFSQGLGSLLAISAAEAAASGVGFSRAGGSTRFSKLAAAAHLGLALGRRWSLSLSARGQSGFGQALFRAEQFQLEGADGLSATIGGHTAVDTGLVGRSELAVDLGAIGKAKLLADIAPYLFGAAGYGKIENHTAVEPGRYTATNLGLGLRMTLGKRITIAGEYAHGFSDYAVLNKVNRGNVTATLRF